MEIINILVKLIVCMALLVSNTAAQSDKMEVVRVGCFIALLATGANS